MARTTLPRRLGAASLLATLVLATAACGSESGADTSPGGSAASSDAAGSDAELEELDAGEFYPAVMEALQDAETFAFTMETGAVGSDAGSSDMAGVMRYDDEGIDMQGKSTGADPMEMILLDQVMYLSGDGLGLTDKKWLKVDLSDPNSLFGMLGKSTDPENMFKAMQDPKTFELLGQEEIDGVATNHYNVVMDSAAYAKAMELPDMVATMMPKEIGIEMWLDADNQPRKFVQEMELPTQGGGEKQASTTTGTYSDFGLDVEIEAPPADEVTEDLGITG